MKFTYLLRKLTKMRNTNLILLCCLAFSSIKAQHLSPEVIGSAGASFSNSTAKTDLTVGEVVIETFSNNTILTQGFLQGIIKVSTGVVNIDIKTKIYPNPTTNFLIIELEKNVNAELLVYDINGKLVIQDKLINEQLKQLDEAA